MNKRNDERRRSRGGFTLIEILLVVVIIGMLATIAAINIPKFLGQGRAGKAQAESAASPPPCTPTTWRRASTRATSAP